MGETSAKIFLPLASTLLKRVTVISARKNYGEKFPGDIKKWKVETFKEIQKCFKSQLITNLICLGDSAIEIYAAYKISKKFKSYYLKVIKFIEKPKPKEVIKELKLVIQSFDYIYSSLKNLYINVENRESS